MTLKPQEPTSTAPAAHKTLNTQGLYCPEPVMLLHGAIAEVDIGQTVKVIATDPSTERDIPKFCEFLGHELTANSSDDDHFYFYVKRLS